MSALAGGPLCVVCAAGKGVPSRELDPSSGLGPCDAWLEGQAPPAIQGRRNQGPVQVRACVAQALRGQAQGCKAPLGSRACHGEACAGHRGDLR
eukprot:1146343-Alexandrium_andersonii.AAC.1